MLSYRILETSKGFEVQEDKGDDVIFNTAFGCKSIWKEDWRTISIKKTLKQAKKELHRLRVLDGGIVHEE